MNYLWKTDEDIETNTRTIIATESVTVQEERVAEFTLEQKEQALANAKKAIVSAQVAVDKLEAELVTIKTALEIK